jgi:hypothetical protein
MNDNKNIIIMQKSLCVDLLIIHSIVPVFQDNIIVFIANTIENLSLPIPIPSHAIVDNLYVKFGNVWIGTKTYQNKDSPYGTDIIYMCNMSSLIATHIQDNGFIDVKLSTKPDINIPIKTKIYDHGIRALEQQYMVVESMNHIFFAGNRQNKCDTIRSILPWIEYHLCKGVDQIFINQSKYFDETDIVSIDFWSLLLKPYLDNNKIKLIIYEDKINNYSHQTIIQNTCLWLNKGRTKWFATHDLDEYICPLNGRWNDNQNIADILTGLPGYVNYVETKMVRTTIPNSPAIYLAPTKIDCNYMTCWSKCIVRTDAVNILWVHTPTHWIDKKYKYKHILRINHYKSINLGTTHSKIPLSRYDGLKNEHDMVLKNINQLYGTELDDIVMDMIKFIDI